MNLRSPIAAMLWENWRLSRVEAAQRLAFGLLAAAGALLLNSRNGATIALWILAAAHGFFWFSISKLNGGRFLDGYKPGFPLYLLYTRPVSTVKLVAVTMAYDALSCTALYVLSAVILEFTFGTPFPLVSVAACLVAYHLASTCIQWSTRNRIVQWVGSMAVFWPLVAVLKSSLDAPQPSGLSLAQYALLIVVSAVSFVLTVVGVARQRRGDAVATEPRTAVATGYPPWLVSLFRFSCPTSSATRAQVWFELRSSGMPILAIGLGLAVLNFLMFAVGIPVPLLRGMALFFAMFSGPFLLIFFGSNAFGIRSKQGRLYASPFDATQPYGTAQMAGLKVLVRTGCLLAALVALGASVWASTGLMTAWGEWKVDGNSVTSGLMYRRTQVANFLAAQSGYELLAMAVIVCIGVAAIVGWQSAREALKVRYPRHVLAAQWSPAAWGLSVALLALAGKSGILPDPVARAGIMAAMAFATVVLVAVPAYLLWSSLGQRALTAHYAGIAFAILATFAVAYGTLLSAVGEPHAGLHWTALLLLSWPVLLVLIGSALAPWALNRVRHT
jgi:hypothetical protein